MIKIKNVKAYCCEDLSLIENYDLAVADTTQSWDCHHRAEILPCGRFSQDDLKRFGLYYNRPASELIFLSHSDHTGLHWKGIIRGTLSDEHKQHISDATKQAMNRPEVREKISNSLKGRSFSDEHKKKISNSLKCRRLTEETKKKLSNSLKGRRLTEEHKNKISKKVFQYDINGNFIAEFKSQGEAAASIGLKSQANLCIAMKNGLPYRNFIWKYA